MEIVLAPLSLLIASSSAKLSAEEKDMVLALRSRDVKKIRTLMDNQIGYFTVMPASPGHSNQAVLDSYLVASDFLKKESDDASLKKSLARFSNLIAKSKQAPQRVKSKHNNLTSYTIRGQATPGDVWELHYDVRPGKGIVLRRICEFDHTPGFQW